MRPSASAPRSPPGSGSARTRSRTPPRRRASTSTRCSRCTRPSGPATTRRSCSTTRATSPTGSGENIFVVKDGRIVTPPLSMSILPGITRDSVIQIAQDLGYVVEEANLIRTDLYLADEIFMTGTAAEVTPVRSVDDHEIGGGPGHARAAEGLPRHGARQDRALESLARPRQGRRQGARRGVKAGSRHGRFRSRRRISTSGTRSSCSRCSGRAGSRSGLRSTGSRSSSPRRSASPMRPRFPPAPPGCTCSARSPASRRATR